MVVCSTYGKAIWAGKIGGHLIWKKNQNKTKNRSSWIYRYVGYCFFNAHNLPNFIILLLSDIWEPKEISGPDRAIFIDCLEPFGVKKGTKFLKIKIFQTETWKRHKRNLILKIWA